VFFKGSPKSWLGPFRQGKFGDILSPGYAESREWLLPAQEEIFTGAAEGERCPALTAFYCGASFAQKTALDGINEMVEQLRLHGH
jgi:hypothetical protein